MGAAAAVGAAAVATVVVAETADMAASVAAVVGATADVAALVGALVRAAEMTKPPNLRRLRLKNSKIVSTRQRRKSHDSVDYTGSWVLIIATQHVQRKVTSIIRGAPYVRLSAVMHKKGAQDLVGSPYVAQGLAGLLD